MAVTTSTIFPESQAIPEGSSRRYTATLLDPDGNTVPAGQVQSILFSLHDARSGAIINNRYRVDVRNQNGGTLANGLFTFVFQPADTVSIGSAKMQKRRAIFETNFIAGRENHELFFFIENLADIPPQLRAALDVEGLYAGDDDGFDATRT